MNESVAGPLFVDFANSEWYDGRGRLEDRLLDPSWRQAFLERWGLTAHGPIDESELQELVDLRSAIRSIVERRREGRAPSARSMDQLGRALAAYPVRFRLSRHGTEVNLDAVPLAERGLRVVAGEVALSAARFLADDEMDRLKRCDNPECRWIFVDETRNRSRRWCGPCGNVDKVRRFRERRRTERGR
jgi:predicted RNA-binding Zn ribbon-like protein